MNKRPKIVFLRATKPYTTAGYYLTAFQELDIDLVDVPFDPAGPADEIAIPEGDLCVLVDCGVPVEFPALDSYRCPTGFVSIDSCHKLDIHKGYCEKYRFDHVWVAQKHMVGEFGPDATWLPLGADPATHAYRPDMASGEGLLTRLLRPGYYDVGMCAAPYDHRRRFEKLFKKAGLSTNFHFRKKFGVEATRETALCTVGFNVGAGFTGAKGKDVNMRVFEGMANGQAMLLTNTYDGLGYEELFTDGVHYVTYRTEEEAVDKALYYSRNPLEAIEIARRGQAHVLANHTYRRRAEQLLASVGIEVA